MGQGGTMLDQDQRTAESGLESHRGIARAKGVSVSNGEYCHSLSMNLVWILPPSPIVTDNP